MQNESPHILLAENVFFAYARIKCSGLRGLGLASYPNLYQEIEMHARLKEPNRTGLSNPVGRSGGE
jgi:hypothetical protein